MLLHVMRKLLKKSKKWWKFIMTSKNIQLVRIELQGSRKIKLKDEDFIINLQGDEPMIDPSRY